MNVLIPAEYQKFVDQLVGEGEYDSPVDVLCDSLELLRAQSEYRHRRHAHLKKLVDEGVEQMKAGRVSPVDPMKIFEEVDEEYVDTNKDS